MNNPEVSIKIVGKNNNGEILSVASTDISNVSISQNKEVEFPLIETNIGKEFVKGNGLTVCFVGELKDNIFNRTGYIFSKDLEKWYFVDFNEQRKDKIVKFNSLNKICFANGYFYLCGNANYLYRSKDLILWEFIQTDGSYKFLDICSGHDETLSISVSGTNCYVLSSLDNGNTWEQKAYFALSSGDSPNRIFYAANQYYIFNDNGRCNLYYSSNGTSFSSLTNYYGTKDIKYGYMESFGDGFVLQYTSTPNVSPSTYKYFVFSDINSSVLEIPVNAISTYYDIMSTGMVAIALKNNSIRFYDMYDMYYGELRVYSSNIEQVRFVTILKGITFFGGTMDSKGQIGVFKEYNGEFVSSKLYNMISGNYKDSNISYISYGKYKDGKYSNLLFENYSSKEINDSGNYDYYAKTFISGNKIKYLLIYFGEDNVFPTKILVNGEEFANNSKEFIVDFDYNKNDQIFIEFVELNKPNSRLGIGSISTDANVIFDKHSGMKSVSFEGQNLKPPIYGVIAYGGDISIYDKDNILHGLSNANLLPNVNVEVYVNSIKIKDFSISNELSINENSKMVGITLIDEIESLQQYMLNRNLFYENISGFDLFQKLSSEFKREVILSQDVNSFLQKIYINKVYIKSNNWWNIWDSFCKGIKAVFSKYNDNNFIIKG